MFELAIITLLTIFIYMTVWYFIALLVKKNDVADIAWGLGFILVGCVLYFFGTKNPVFMIILLLTTFWGLRLVFHIYLRNKGKPEDFRYKNWRTQWGRWFYIRTYVQVFLLQGLFMFIISFSAIVAAGSTSSRIGIQHYLGILVWLIGFFFESVGDYQLKKFIMDASRKGRIMTTGLWRYTRHPNYFGEVTQWWGIFLIACTVSMGFIAILSPLTITFLILKVSGIPMLEKKYDGNLEFLEYKKTTNAFFPWFPKKSV